MSNIAGAVVQWIAKYFISFLLIVSVLWAGSYVRNEYHRLDSIKTDIATLNHGVPEIKEFVISKKTELFQNVSELHLLAVGSLDSRIKNIESEIQNRQSIRNNLADYFSQPIGKGFIDRYKLDIEIELLSQEREYLVRLHSLALARIDLEAGKIELERRRQVHLAINDQYHRKELERENEKAKSKTTITLSKKNYFGYDYFSLDGEFKKLNQELADLAKQSVSARKDYDDQNLILELRNTEIAKLTRSFKVNESRIDAIVAPLRTQISNWESEVGGHWLSKFQNPSISIYQQALLIVLGAMLLPPAIKVLFYYVLSPLAARRPPICIFPKSSSSTILLSHDSSSDSRISAVSQKIIVDKDHELLLHPEYLQSSSVHGKADTKFLLDWSCPLSSLASGLVGLTRIQSDHSETIVVSSTKDPFSEVALVSLAEGEGMVFQPRSLVGVLYPKGRPVRITRHWQLWSSHAWLTLQLRYLVFHGPVTLIVKGCRGVRVEKAGTGRRISQAATMGFSANLNYSTIRTETFMPYLLGKQELLIDSFEGSCGSYVYEEMPNYGKKAGVVGRGLEGVTDSILKVFGV